MLASHMLGEHGLVCTIVPLLLRRREQYCRNVALKVNQKVGGVNHAIHTGGGAGAAGSHTRGPQPAAGGAGGGGGADVEGADDPWLPQPLRGKVRAGGHPNMLTVSPHRTALLPRSSFRLALPMYSE